MEKRKLHRLPYVGLLAVLGWALPLDLSAQTTSGGSQSPFELGGSARALGMGNATVALTGEGDSFFENPASLATLNIHQILTFHAPLFLDTLYDSLAYTHPIAAHSSFGLSAARLAVDGVPETTTNILAVSSFTAEQLEGRLGYGFRVLDDLDFGATVKYLHEQLSNYQGSGIGVDLGLLYRFAKGPQDYTKIGVANLTLGVALSNALQPETKLYQTADQPVRVLRPGLSYLLRFPGSRDRIWLAAEAQVPQVGTPLYQGGIEYGWNDTAFIRAGFDGVSPTAGAGLKISDFQVDYAYNQRELGTLHRFSLSYFFGRYSDPLQAQKIDLLKWVARSYASTNDYGPAIKSWQNVQREFPDDGEAAKAIADLQARRKKEVRSQLDAAESAMARKDYERALPLIAKVMSLDPGNPRAKQLLSQVDKKTMLSTNYTRGVEAYSREDYALAVQYLQNVYEDDPHYRDVNFLYHDAMSHYLPLESMSKEATELYGKGVDEYMKGDYHKAIDYWNQVLEKSPKNFLVRRNIEEAKSRMNDKATAPPGKP